MFSEIVRLIDREREREKEKACHVSVSITAGVATLPWVSMTEKAQ